MDDASYPPHMQVSMRALKCSKDTSLSDSDKAKFADSLERHGLSLDIWDLFGQWVARSTKNVSFFYLKVQAGDELVGLGLMLRVDRNHQAVFTPPTARTHTMGNEDGRSHGPGCRRPGTWPTPPVRQLARTEPEVLTQATTSITSALSALAA